MNYTEAVSALKEGEKVKLPEWTGYWFQDEQNNIMVYTADCRVLNTPFTDDYTKREDWVITDGSRDFGGALKALRAKKKVSRNGWNNSFISIELQVPDENSKMTLPYIFMNKNQDKFPCDLSCESLLAEDWYVID